MRRFGVFLLLIGEALVVFVGTANAIIYFSARSYVYENVDEVPRAEAILILGAPLTPEGAPAPIFVDRITTALALYRAGKADRILVSGDDGSAGHNEVDPVRMYLLESGVPDDAIFLDHAGFDTYSSMYRAREIFKASSLIVATQSFHLPRSLFLARRLGITAYGMNADAGHIIIDNYIRELFANVKALIDLARDRQPKYLGEPIPFSGTTTPAL